MCGSVIYNITYTIQRSWLYLYAYVNNLEDNTTYYYKFGNNIANGLWSNEYSFKTGYNYDDTNEYKMKHLNLLCI